jgi:hypothetical protein
MNRKPIRGAAPLEVERVQTGVRLEPRPHEDSKVGPKQAARQQTDDDDRDKKIAKGHLVDLHLGFE